MTDVHGREAIAIRPVMTLALTFDHRVIDGAYATRCVVRIKRAARDWWTATGHRREGRETAPAAVGAFGSVTYFLGVDIGGTFTDCVAVD